MFKRLSSLAVLVIILYNCMGANLLFKDSFEGDTKVYDFYTNTNQWWQSITGSADTLGLIWPNLDSPDVRDPNKLIPVDGSLPVPPLKSFGSCQCQLWHNDAVYSNPSRLLIAGTPRNYQGVGFVYTAGRLGPQTRTWYMRMFRENPPGFQGAPIALPPRIIDLDAIPDVELDDAGTVRANCIVIPDSTIGDWQMYQSMWIKFSDRTDEAFLNTNTFKFWDLWEYKSFPNPCDPDGPGGVPIDNFNFDTRIATGFVSQDPDAGGPLPFGLYWTCGKETLDVVTCVHLQNNEWEIPPTTVASLGVVMGNWFKFEVFVKNSSNPDSGRFWLRVNGNIVQDIATSTYRPGYKIGKWNLWKNYVHDRVYRLPGNLPYPAEIWIDELEFWDDIPNP